MHRRGPPGDGKLWCCDVSEEWTRIGKRYWKEAGLESRIELTVAPALKTLDWLLAQGLGDQLDLAFIDADKTNYDAYYERCLKLVRRGGLLLIDNVIWGGSVANLADKDDNRGDPRAQRQAQEGRARRSDFARRDGMTCALKRYHTDARASRPLMIMRRARRPRSNHEPKRCRRSGA